MTRQAVCALLYEKPSAEVSKEELKRRLERADMVIQTIKAVRVETQEMVAVKCLESEHTNWDDIRQELATMRSMNHENVVRVYSAFVNELDAAQELWIVMPLLAVGSCSSVLREFYPNGIKDPKIIATILHKVLKALAYFHKDGRIHRDVKAGNILLSGNGEVKLADFGVSANTIEHGSRDDLRKTFVGTPCWMAPEVMEQRSGYNTKADIWSFGITAMELAYGHAPYAHEKAMKVLVLTLRNPPPTCMLYSDYNNPKFPKVFHRMIAKCLEKNPASRPDAKRMLTHGFFREKQDKNYLYENLIKHVLEERAKKNPPKKFTEEEKKPSGSQGPTPYKVPSFVLPEGSEEMAKFRKMRDRLKKEQNKTSDTNKSEDAGSAPDSGGVGSDGLVEQASSVDTNVTERKVGRFTVKGESVSESKRGRFTIKGDKTTSTSTEDSVKKVGRFTVKNSNVDSGAVLPATAPTASTNVTENTPKPTGGGER
uniref:Protein kinase domain-containing protein n=2 Tax=Amorphochlora amoebiformis TaxID=1561963 RepID=A0A7S0CWE8_9EUKA|mmetsp:Transcript_14708/g.23267  ORF Transcript_14708/g.23267 Transcript_14708/m.23267 type:complete len:483 (+) Transcript_14708:288-1736(+)